MPPIPRPAPEGTTTTHRAPAPLGGLGPGGRAPPARPPRRAGAHHDYLLPQLLRLAERHDAIFYDQRGGGRSRVDGREPVTWQTHVDDLAAVARELVVADGGPLHLVGYSWGGLLALLYAIAATSDAALPPPASLTLIDPAPITRAHRATFEAAMAERGRSPAVQALRAELAASGLRERDPAAYQQRTFELAVAGYFHDPARARDLTPFRVTGRVQQEVWASLGDYDLRPALAGVRVPTLVVHGREDPIPLARARRSSPPCQTLGWSCSKGAATCRTSRRRGRCSRRCCRGWRGWPELLVRRSGPARECGWNTGSTSA
jgi:proline iminopeptidase